MLTRSCTALRMATVFGLMAPGCAGRHGQTIPDDLNCAGCSIISEVVAVLGAADGPAALSSGPRTRMDAEGRFWVFSQGMMPKVFDQRGAFIRAVGTRGPGPGEFQGPSDLWQLPGDSVLVEDYPARLHLLDPELRYVRTMPSPLLGSKDAIALQWPTSVVVNALDPRPPKFGLPLHLVDFSGPTARVLRSFGGNGQSVNSSTMYTRLDYALTPSRTGGYWSAAAAWYTISKWSEQSEREFTLERRPEWFPGESDLMPGGPEKPPSPRCMGVSEDETGLLWSFCRVPSADYQKAYAELPDGAKGVGEGPSNSAEPLGELLYHTTIEVIDPVARRVVARRTIDDAVQSVLPGQQAAVVDHSAEGVPTVRIIRFVLHGYSR